MDKNKEKLKKYNLYARFHYNHFSDGSVLAECRLSDQNKASIAYGYSLCSPLDHFTKAEARNKTMGRAICAIDHRKSMFPIKGGSHKASKYFTRNYVHHLAIYL